MDELDRVIEKYAGTNFCALAAHKQAEYMGALARRGASDALKAIGLNDPQAADDIRDIRDLLRGLRVLKKAAWTTAFSGLGRIIGWIVLLAIAALFLNGKNARDIAGFLGGS
ncbi:MAG: DUF6127 family protein [Alphaproteobacteria bacterium]|nr:DUF6127 family protein [Alphaproteobacteria bacterium]